MSERRFPPSPANSVAGTTDTIAAIATAWGRGAISLIRVSGPRAFDVAAACLTPWPLTPRRATLVAVRAPDSGVVEDQGVAITYPGPHSFTGEDTVEITSHGGTVAPTRVLASLIRAGARPAEPGEFTRRAVLNGKLDLLQAEALGDLIDAPTALVHRTALAQLSGNLTRQIASLRDQLIELEALLAYDIDFPEEDDGPIDRSRVARAAATVRDSIERLLATLPAARIAREGAVVVLAGVPNAGKSSLFNALLGEQRAIVTEHPGTTRDAIDALVEAEPYPLRFVDTAGLRDASDPVERLGVEVSVQWLERADIVLACGTSETARDSAARAIGAGPAVIRVHTMADRDFQSVESHDGAVRVSAVTSDGLASLRTAIGDALRDRYRAPDPATPLILRARQETALRDAAAELDSFATAWGERALPAPVAAVHVRAAVHALDLLIGAVDLDEVLGRVFERFCVGK